MPDTTPEPDEFGRLRVTDLDTGHKSSIYAAQLPHGNYRPLKQPASDIAGDALPPEFNTVEPTGQTATNQKEKADG